MSTAQGPVELTDEIVIPGGLPHEHMRRIRAIARRRHYEADPDLAEVREAAHALTYALEYRRAPRPAPRPERRFVRALSWNIERGNRLDAILDFFARTEAVRDCDVVMLNEVDIGMARSGNKNVAAEIAAALGFEYVFGNSYLCLGHGDVRDPKRDEDNAVGLHGNAILSRHPIVRAETFSIAITRDKFHSEERRLGHKKALWAEIAGPLGPLAVVATHLDPYASPRQRTAQMDDVLTTIAARGLADPVLLGGDLNTTTYDLENPLRLVLNVLAKLVRGGFAHAIHSYMRPFERYETGIRDALVRAGFAIEAFNAMDQGTIRYEVGTFDSESKIREHLPGFVVKLLEYKLRPWNGVAPLKLDWFAGRGLRPLAAGERVEPGGRSSLAPLVFERTRHAGAQISDHDPILVDVAPT